MHGSLHLIFAHESHRNRQASAREARRAAPIHRPFAAIAARVAAAHGFPLRAAPGADSPALDRNEAASLGGR
ncbi:MAG TPA: hypothetical protein VKA57_16330 [Solirubrobacteraceae bacterium]|nr:hypothetical protein [Solirubrobacteraceae bacterium]